jgi:hypothetical protein
LITIQFLGPLLFHLPAVSHWLICSLTKKNLIIAIFMEFMEFFIIHNSFSSIYSISAYFRVLLLLLWSRCLCKLKTWWEFSNFLY